MVKCSVAILAIIILQLIFGTLARPKNLQLSEKQITKLREIATQWAEVINFEKNPCENFYDFVCSTHKYPESKMDFSEYIKEVILKINTDSITETERKFLKYSEMNEEFKEDEKEEFIKWFKLENSIGSWPAFVENWDDSKFNLQQAIAELNLYGHPVVFKITHIYDFQNNFEPTLEIDKQNFVGIEKTKDLFKSKFEKLGVKNPEDVLTDAELFEKTFKEEEDPLDIFSFDSTATEKRIKFSELKDYLPEIDWDKQIDINYGKKIPSDYSVLIYNHEKLKSFYKAISDLSPKVIANYFFCAFVYNLNGNIYSQSETFFMPVIKQAFLKHAYDHNEKEILKGMYVTIVETVQENFNTHYSAEQLATFFDEEFFGFINEEELTKEFKEVSLNSNERLKNYHYLQKIIKKRLPFLKSENHFFSSFKEFINLELLYRIPRYIEDPSPFSFSHIFFSVFIVFGDIKNPINYPSETLNCFSKQLTKELTTENIQNISIIQLILKTFAKWTKNYPNAVQEENKILQEYDLTAEKLLILSFEKLTCKSKEEFTMLMTAFANSPESSKMFDCPLGSKMNAATKCNL